MYKRKVNRSCTLSGKILFTDVIMNNKLFHAKLRPPRKRLILNIQCLF